MRTYPKENTWERIIGRLIGHKYYLNLIHTIGTQEIEASSYIFGSKKDADAHKEQVNKTRSFDWVETVSFRSRKALIRV